MSKRRVYNILSVLMITFLLMSIGYVVYEYFEFSQHLTASAMSKKQASVDVFKHLALKFGIALAVNIGVVLLTVTILMISRQSSDAQVIYVKKTAEINQDTEQVVEAGGEEEENDGLKNAADYHAIFSGTTELKDAMNKVLSLTCKELEASQAAFFIAKRYESKRILELFATYAYHIAESKTFHYEFGEGLAGQVAKEGQMVTIKSVPEGYITVLSGLGKATPSQLVIAPILYQDQVIGVMEIASFQSFRKADEIMIRNVTQLVSTYLADNFSEVEITSKMNFSTSVV